MVVDCPVCREVVFLQCGYIQRHGFKNHGKTDVCRASGTPYRVEMECCERIKEV